MAVMITEECINCEACASECPVAAILEDSNEKNPFDDKFYVKPEACVECVNHADEPRCVEAIRGGLLNFFIISFDSSNL
jgi:ferredoxin